MRILVVGAGSVGGYFGGRLAQAGLDVSFLVRAGRARELRAHGLRIRSPHGDAEIHPAIVTQDEIDGPYDVVLFSVKAYALDAAIDSLAAAVGPETMILPVLNGMRHIDALSARFGEGAVLGGVCLVATYLDDDGAIVQMNEMQQLVYGERSGLVTGRIRALDDAVRRGAFEARLSETIVQEMWEKWVMLASLGAATCLMRGTIGEIEARPNGTAFLLAVLDECAAVASSCGYSPGRSFLDSTRQMMTRKGSPQTSSMYRDLVKGRPVEADHLIGDLIARGRRQGVATPMLDAAYVHLRVYQARLSQQAG